MEFYINHTRQEIARLPTDEWEEDDDIDREMIHLDDEEDVKMMMELIETYDYYIDPEDRVMFMKEIDMERLIAEQYEKMVQEETEDAKSTGSWAGWDEAGASFDY